MIFTGYNFQILDKLFAFKSSSWKNNMLISTNIYVPVHKFYDNFCYVALLYIWSPIY